MAEAMWDHAGRRGTGVVVNGGVNDKGNVGVNCYGLNAGVDTGVDGGVNGGVNGGINAGVNGCISSKGGVNSGGISENHSQFTINCNWKIGSEVVLDRLDMYKRPILGACHLEKNWLRIWFGDLVWGLQSEGGLE